MKKLVLSLAVAALALGANAQSSEGKQLSFGIGARIALPIGSFGDGYSIGIGGEAQAEYMFSNTASAVGSIGYTTYAGKEIDLGAFGKFKNPSAAFIPIMVGARYYPAQQFFVGAKVGYAVSAQSGGTGGFSYEPQVGFNASHFQASLGYNGISASGSSLGSIGASLIYKF
ncbi:MAG: hypothetical protein EOO08_05380 [Chitinophagaceae bacterium]|nr:MAG: hypothetical protein EOO08_05380 [Chitinophagaceae bacterium]